jgi:hypothetical protein
MDKVRNACYVIFFALLSIPAFAKPKVIPKSPLPAIVQSAKTAFLTNGGGTPLAFDEFYSQMKQWGRFQLTASPSEADIVIELKYVVVDMGQHTGSAYNSYTKQTSVYSHDVTDPQLVLSIYEPKTGSLLWSTTDHRREARRVSNQNKEIVNSADRLVQELQDRIAPPSTDSK